MLWWLYNGIETGIQTRLRDPAGTWPLLLRADPISRRPTLIQQSWLLKCLFSRETRQESYFSKAGTLENITTESTFLKGTGGGASTVKEPPWAAETCCTTISTVIRNFYLWHQGHFLKYSLIHVLLGPPPLLLRSRWLRALLLLPWGALQDREQRLAEATDSFLPSVITELQKKLLGVSEERKMRGSLLENKGVRQGPGWRRWLRCMSVSSGVTFCSVESTWWLPRCLARWDFNPETFLGRDHAFPHLRHSLNKKWINIQGRVRLMYANKMCLYFMEF